MGLRRVPVMIASPPSGRMARGAVDAAAKALAKKSGERSTRRMGVRYMHC